MLWPRSLSGLLAIVALSACSPNTIGLGEGSDDVGEDGDTSTTEESGEDSSTDGSTDAETTDAEDSTDAETTDAETTQGAEEGEPECGNGRTELGEQCDDGNEIDDDECANDCTLNPYEFVVELDDMAGLTIPEDMYDATLESMACIELNFIAEAAVVDVTAQLIIEHSWVGELVAKVVSPEGTEVTLFSRPGLDEAFDGDGSCCGDDSYFGATGPLNFNDDFAASAEDMGVELDIDETVCVSDGVCDFQPHPGATGSGPLSDFADEPVDGTWMLCLGDKGVIGEGELVGAGLSITAFGIP